jgi:hypothetical protein
MNWSNQDITNSFYGIIRDAKNLNSEELSDKYVDFKESFSKLYSVAIDAVVNDRVQDANNMLQIMLDARKKMQDGKMTKLTTDMFVGNQLGKKYIYPKTNNPSQEDYMQAFNKIKEQIKQNEIEDLRESIEITKPNIDTNDYIYDLSTKYQN